VPAEGINAKGWNAVQRLNVEGTLHMTHSAYELAMRPAATGAIVNVTVSPHHGMPAMAHTGAARAAVEAITRELASRWIDDGVAVMAIALGRLATESLRKYPAELWRRAAQTVPLQRLGEVEEYGWLVALLGSPLGRAFSGSVLTLDGGLDILERALAAPGALTRREGAHRGAPACRLRCKPEYDLARSAGEVSTAAREPSKL